MPLSNWHGAYGERVGCNTEYTPLCLVRQALKETCACPIGLDECKLAIARNALMSSFKHGTSRFDFQHKRKISC